MKGAPLATGRGFSALVRRLPRGASGLSPRARIWLMSGYGRISRSIIPHGCMARPTCDPNTLPLVDGHVGEDLVSAKASPHAITYSPEYGDQNNPRETRHHGISLAAAAICGRGQRVRKREGEKRYKPRHVGLSAAKAYCFPALAYPSQSQ